MTPHSLFELTGPLAMIGWLALALSPVSPLWTQRVALTVALAQAVLYTGLILAFWTSAEGGFGSLADVMRLFDTDGVALAGWVHYLSFDLFVGAWIARQARREAIPHIFVLICLVPCFLFGPIGLVLFFAIRAAFALRPQTA